MGTEKDRRGGEKYRAQLCAILGQEKLEAQKRQLVESYYGLLTDDAAMFLIAKREGIAKDAQVGVADARQWMRKVNVQGKITRIFPMQSYEKNASVKKSARAVLEDKSGQITLVLWNSQAQLLFGEIGVGDLVRVENAYVTKDGELSLGAEGKISLEAAAALSSIGKMEEGLHNVEGEVKEIFLDYHYMRNGEERKMGSFLLAQGQKEIRVVLWANPQQANGLKMGQRVKLENALFKNRELQLGEQSRMVKLGEEGRENVLEGEISSMRLEGEKIIAQLGGKEAVFQGSAACALLGLGFLPEGISLSCAFEMKKAHVLGKKATVETEEKEGEKIAKSVLCA